MLRVELNSAWRMLAIFALLLSDFAWAQTAELSQCLSALRPHSARHGIAAEAFDRYAAEIAWDPSVLDALDAQPEVKLPIWDYLAGLVDEERVADGLRLRAEYAATLAEIAARYGVDAETVLAVWGVESDYGRNLGKRPLLNSLATLSCAGRRQSYFRGEFFAALRILRSGDIDPDDLRGSWAGAFGQTQFMPSTFERLAVDFDRDGRRDLVGNAVDALASTAHYLKQAGWRRGERWGFEVRLPAGFDPSPAGRRHKRPLADWVARGVTRGNGAALIGMNAPAERAAALLLPAGIEGPAFIVFRNYDAIYSYNAAESYALAIALLSDRLRGDARLIARWPTEDPGLSRVERRELQTLLIQRGYILGEADGVIGHLTREAIRSEQRRLGWEPDGRAGWRLLDTLRGLNN